MVAKSTQPLTIKYLARVAELEDARDSKSYTGSHKDSQGTDLILTIQTTCEAFSLTGVIVRGAL